MRSDTATDRVIVVGGAELLSLGEAVASAGAELWVRVRGSSMMPAISRGAEIRVGPLPARELRAGDVVLARSATGSPVVHRISRIAGPRVWLKGDFRLAADAPIDASEILCLVDAVRIEGTVRPVAPRRSRAWRDVVRRLRAALKDYIANA